MANYKQREEEKKRRRAEMMAKFPQQNPRENVSTMLLRKDVPAASAATKQQAEQTSNAARDVGQFVDRYVVDAHRDFGNNPDRHKIKAQTLGVTGSDQTVASFYGYQNDTRHKKPQNHWDVETKKEYRMMR